MSFALKLKELRENKGLTQRELASALNVGTGSIGMWESTNRIPPTKKMKAIADYFGVSVDYLLGHNEITPTERAAGATDKIMEKVTPMEYEMLYRFREIGKRHGADAQQALITVADKMM